ncbi:MAG: serine/threonine-protein kinase [Vicinamibacterales bacterium]
MPSTPSAGSTPLSAGSPAGGVLRLPPRLLESASKRLCMLSVLVASVVVFVQILQQFTQPALGPVLADPLNRLSTLASVLAAIGLFALGHYRIVPPSTIIGLGMAFEVLVAWTISLVETTLPFPAGQPLVGMSSLGPWVFAVGVLVPNRPAFTLMTALLAATTWPAAFAFNAARFDFPDRPTGEIVVWPVMNYMLAVLSFVIGRWYYGTSIAAQAAQDLGSYRLVSRIGTGGMGEVWMARHQMLARDAAIKLVKPQGESARQADLAVRRFKREANIIASLQSPNTVYLYDFGVTEDGHFYYVMELLDGISLQELVTTFGPQPAARVAAILRQLCASLEEAHQKDLLHRDLKPSNIMLCKVALAHDVVKVLDFGLAKAIGPSEGTQLTLEGVTTGTPGYMAPEIAMGESRVDARADIYAMGCVAYFLLTGTMVFEDPNPMAMALKHVQAAPDPPSSRTELPIPESLELLILACLAKKPDDRPASVREMLDQLDACDVPAWTADEADRWWERHLPPGSSLRSVGAPSGPTPPVVRKM